MLNKFYIKFFLFCAILFLCALIIDAKKNSLNLPLYLEEDVSLNEQYSIEEAYLIYVADLHHMIFPLNIITKQKDDYLMDYYQGKIENHMDKQIYMTFSLLTNYSNYLPVGVKTFVPKSTKLLNYEIKDDILILNVSEDFLNYSQSEEDKLIQVLTYTYTNLLNVDKIQLVCDNNTIAFDSFHQDTFSKQDFILNVIIKSTDINNRKPYYIYYLTNIESQHYLVPTTIIDKETDNTETEHILSLLTKTFSIPLKTFVEVDNLDEIKNNTIFRDELSYYQYYLTCFENNIKEVDNTVDIKNINFYEIEFK